MSKSEAEKPSNKYLFDIKDYEIIGNISEGGFGDVYFVRNKITGEEFAAKTNRSQTKGKIKLFVSREVRILMQIQHPTIIKFRGFSNIDFNGNKNVTILMDYMKEGSLADLISKESKGLCSINYDNTKRQIILIGIARGMMILHSFHVIHRDLKPENILIDSNFQPYITDFGLSKFYDPKNSMNQSNSDFGTAAYMPPEVINSDKFNTKADVYSFGIIMYEILSGKRAYEELFQGKNKITIFTLKKKVSEGYRPVIEEGSIKKSLQLLIEKCWSENPSERPTFSELFKKLSLSNEDYFSELEENAFEPTIIDDDDDDDDVDDHEFNKKYCLDDVNYDELFDYIDEVSQKPFSMNKKGRDEDQKNEELKEEMKKMSLEILSLKKELEEAKNSTSNLTETDLRNKIKDQDKEIKSLKSELSSIQQRTNGMISVNISEESPGILSYLKKMEKSPFDRLFIIKNSNRDPFNLIDSEVVDEFGTANKSNFFIEFVFKEAITMKGIMVQSSGKHFPRSFDIEVEGKIVKSIEDAHQLNGKFKKMTIDFSPTRGKKIKFIQTGRNWDNTGYLHLMHFEVLSSEDRFPEGVFKSFMNDVEDGDPHKCPVLIFMNHFDSNFIYDIHKKCDICIPNKNPWFQIELTKGYAILKGFRIARDSNDKLKSYKIICTENPNDPINSWITLFSINEDSIQSNPLLYTHEFDKPSPPTRFVRIILTGNAWNDKSTLRFHHLELFGTYF